jgi:hypothetical protein
LLWYQLGLVDQALGRDADARASLERHIAADPDVAESIPCSVHSTQHRET